MQAASSPVVNAAQGNVNALQIPKLLGKYAFWNLENLTGDLIHYGVRVQKESLTSERNLFRIECIAKAVIQLDLDGLVLLELGSDGEQVVRQIAARCAQLGNREVWETTFSLDNGPKFPPIDLVTIDLTSWMDHDVRAVQLISLFGAYYVSKCALRAPTGLAYLRLYVEIAAKLGIEWRSNVGAMEALWFTYYDEDEPYAETRPNVHAKLQIPEVGFISALLDGKPVDLKAILTSGDLRDRIVAAIFLSRFADKLEVIRYSDDLAPAVHRVLRHYGYNTGRYEKYGAITRVHTATEQFIQHHLVTETSVQQSGLATNSRAAWCLRLPLRPGSSIPIFCIHSMYSKARDTDEDTSARKLRVQTLVAQAEYANTLSIQDKPLIICGDFNIVRKDSDGTFALMKGQGYNWCGAGATNALLSTSLRSEKTLLFMSRREVINTGFWSEPYDLVYAREGAFAGFKVEYPVNLWDVWNLVTNVPFVRAWFCNKCEILYDAMLGAARSRHVKLPGHIGPAVEAIEQEMLSGDDGRRFTAIVNLQAVLHADAANDSPNSSANRFWNFMQCLDELSAGSDRLYTLFHQCLVSDHRMCVFNIERRDDW